jgi:hypothetical protein
LRMAEGDEELRRREDTQGAVERVARLVADRSS